MAYTDFAEFAPDSASLNANASRRIINAFPDNNGYAPVPQLLKLCAAPKDAVSVWACCSLTGEVFVLCGTPSSLWRLENGGWRDVSASPYHINPEIGWSFAYFNRQVIAAAQGCAPQIWDFALQKFLPLENKYKDPNNAKDFKPQEVPYAARLAAGPEFLFLLSADEKRSRLYWSGIRDPESWEVGQNTAGYQDFDVGGEVMAMSQGTSPLLLLEKAIYALNRVDVEGGFIFQKLETDIGCFYPNSAAVLGTRIYFVDESGFMSANEVDKSTRNIGFGKVNEMAKEFLTPRVPHCPVHAFADARNRRIYWVFPDKSLVYDELRDKWAFLDRGGRAACSLPYQAVNLDAIRSSLDPLGKIPPLDSTLWRHEKNLPLYLAGGEMRLQAGPNSEALLESNLSGGTDRGMVNINSVNPIVDNGCFDMEAKILGDNNFAHEIQPANWLRQSKIDGICRTRWRGRTARIAVKIPANAVWSRAQGVDADLKPQGKR